LEQVVWNRSKASLRYRIHDFIVCP
jgi:hypothetical protein